MLRYIILSILRMGALSSGWHCPALVALPCPAVADAALHALPPSWTHATVKTWLLAISCPHHAPTSHTVTFRWNTHMIP